MMTYYKVSLGAQSQLSIPQPTSAVPPQVPPAPEAKRAKQCVLLRLN
jgi:hypothetical protein